MTAANPLQHYAATRDAQAFAALLEHYGPMVYATCRRILGPSAAEDATQEVFFKLARQAATIRGNAGAWLHRCATHHCLGVLRSDARRARRDRLYETVRQSRAAEGETTWGQVAPRLDEAIERLPPEARDLLVEHYLHQRTQTQLAAAQGVSVATICRRLDKALGTLRTQLQSTGLAVAPPALLAVLQHGMLLPLPATLLAAAPRIALGGGALAAGRTAGWLGKLIPAAVGAGLLACLVALYLSWPAARLPAAIPPAAALTVPAADFYSVRTIRMVSHPSEGPGEEEETLIDRDRGLLRYTQHGREVLFDNGQTAWRMSPRGEVAPQTPQFHAGELPKDVVDLLSAYGGAPARRLPPQLGATRGYELTPGAPQAGPSRVWVDPAGRPRRIEIPQAGQTWERLIEYDVDLGPSFEQAQKTFGELPR